jgi:hypothetical protein
MSKLIVLALQATKDEPDNPANKIAFTLDSALCFVTDPRAAHEIIKAAVEHIDYERRDKGYRQIWLFNAVGKILAARTDLVQIAKRA